MLKNKKIGTLRRTCICTFKKYWACHGTLQSITETIKYFKQTCYCISENYVVLKKLQNRCCDHQGRNT